MSEDLPTKSALTIADYERLAQRTNRFAIAGARGFDLPMLGLFGEAGSVLSAVKKRRRDDTPTDQYLRTVEEEIGDLLWYVAIICNSAGLSLEKVFVEAAKEPVRRSAGIRFSDIESQYERTSRAPPDRLVALSISLAADVGNFVASYSKGHVPAGNMDRLEGNLVPIMVGLMRAASGAGVKLQDAAILNLRKNLDRWPIEPRVYLPPFDANHADETELLPRLMEIRIQQRKKRGKVYVFQSCSGVNIGDPLTDNIRDEDNYRFHDVFHYAYAGILGWSPVTRALFKLKRKSDPDTDEAEDGARAILIEEGISTTVFNYAKGLRLLEGVKAGDLSFDLLKMVRSFVHGYEVAKAPFWQWEEAILAGFKCFRYLEKHKEGLLKVDMTKRTVDIGPLP